MRAFRAGEKAGAVGFDLPDAEGPREKILEELDELEEAQATGDRRAMAHELGDLLFAVVNLARKLGLDAESALRESTDRFARRFSLHGRGRPGQRPRGQRSVRRRAGRLWEAAKAALAEEVRPTATSSPLAEARGRS